MAHDAVEATLLFTDIEGSTSLVQQLGDTYVDVLTDHNRIIGEVLSRFTAIEVRNEGDAFFAAFASSHDAVHAAFEAQCALARHTWPHGRPVRVRMGLHRGPIILLPGDFAGLHVHLAARICSAAHGGQVVASRAVVDTFEPDANLTWVDLGAHLVKDFAEPVAFFQLAAPEIDASFPPLATADARDHNLPAPITSFVGRRKELADIRDLVIGGARLVVITGPGGAGKTRTAIEAGSSLLSRFARGAWFVDFSGVRDPAELIAAIARTIDVAEAPTKTPLAAVAEALSGAPSLLILDNLEHLASGAAVIAELLWASPAVSVLATSRERLRLQGEREVTLDGLAPPDAVRLFEERARLVLRDFEATPESAALCERVGGLPLAIELAAARLRTESPASLLAAMDSMLDALSEGERDRPARHQALRAAIAISVDALTDAELRVFRTFAVFAGGATPDAVDAVCVPKADEVASLVDKSLLRRDGLRLTMLEPIRQFAEERLTGDTPGEFDDAVTRHAAHYLRFAQGSETELLGRNQRAALAAIEADHDNLRSAMQRSDAQTALRISGSLSRFWTYRGHVHEGRAALARALAADDGRDNDARAKALCGAGQLALAHHDLDAARALLGEAVSRADGVQAAFAHNLFGELLRLSGQLDEADAAFTTALRHAEIAGDDRAVAVIRINQGVNAVRRQDYIVAADTFRKAAALSELTGDEQALSRSVGNLGFALMQLEEPRAALEAFQRSLEVAVETGNRASEAAARQNIAWALQILNTPGDLDAAANHLHAAIDLFDELGYRRELAAALISLPGLIDDLDAALRAVNRAAALFEQVGDRDGVARADELRTMLAEGRC